MYGSSACSSVCFHEVNPPMTSAAPTGRRTLPEAPPRQELCPGHLLPQVSLPGFWAFDKWNHTVLALLALAPLRYMFGDSPTCSVAVDHFIFIEIYHHLFLHSAIRPLAYFQFFWIIWKVLLSTPLHKSFGSDALPVCWIHMERLNDCVARDAYYDLTCKDRMGFRNRLYQFIFPLCRGLLCATHFPNQESLAFFIPTLLVAWSCCAVCTPVREHFCVRPVK